MRVSNIFPTIGSSMSSSAGSGTGVAAGVGVCASAPALQSKSAAATTRVVCILIPRAAFYRDSEGIEDLFPHFGAAVAAGRRERDSAPCRDSQRLLELRRA